MSSLATFTPNGISPIKNRSLRGGIARAVIIVGLTATFGWISVLGFGIVKAAWLIADRAFVANVMLILQN